MGQSIDADLNVIFKIYRDYVEHEDELIYQRTHSLVTIQSFLLATFGLCYQKRFEIAAMLLKQGQQLSDIKINNEYNGLMLALAFVGIATSLIALVSVRAARKAIEDLNSEWNRIKEKCPQDYLPRLIGGGNPEAAKHGFHLSLYIPRFFLLFWIVTIYMLWAVFDVRVDIDLKVTILNALTR
jgi:hypothetical protein